MTYGQYGKPKKTQRVIAGINPPRRKKRVNGPTDDRYTGMVRVATPSPAYGNAPNNDQYTGMVPTAAPRTVKRRVRKIRYGGMS